ncbi:MAG: uracil phosphoribosyltransferase [Bacteroidota bacterium]
MVVNVINKEASVVNQFLLEMRDVQLQKDRARFRNNLRKLGMVMAYEISKTLSYREEIVNTPLAQTKLMVPKNPPVLIGILRAALPFVNGISEIFDQSDVGFIGAYRNENGDEISIAMEYMAVPDLDDKDVILADPMLATGKSVVDAVNGLLEKAKPRHLYLLSAVAAPEGIEYISKNLTTDCTLWVGSLDEKLNDKSYIVPGLGDAGDLSFGSKV